MLIRNDLEIILFIIIIMDNQNVLIATAGFAIAGVAGYMYLNRSDDVVSENAKLGTTKVSDLKPEGDGKSWWSSFWGEEHKKQQVMEELKEKVNDTSSLYN